MCLTWEPLKVFVRDPVTVCVWGGGGGGSECCADPAAGGCDPLLRLPCSCVFLANIPIPHSEGTCDGRGRDPMTNRGDAPVLCQSEREHVCGKCLEVSCSLSWVELDVLTVPAPHREWPSSPSHSICCIHDSSCCFQTLKSRCFSWNYPEGLYVRTEMFEREALWTFSSWTTFPNTQMMQKWKNRKRTELSPDEKVEPYTKMRPREMSGEPLMMGIHASGDVLLPWTLQMFLWPQEKVQFSRHPPDVKSEDGLSQLFTYFINKLSSVSPRFRNGMCSSLQTLHDPASCVYSRWYTLSRVDSPAPASLSSMENLFYGAARIVHFITQSSKCPAPCFSREDVLITSRAGPIAPPEQKGGCQLGHSLGPQKKNWDFKPHFETIVWLQPRGFSNEQGPPHSAESVCGLSLAVANIHWPGWLRDEVGKNLRKYQHHRSVQLSLFLW